MLMMIIVGFFVFVGLIAGFFYWFAKHRENKRYPFIVYNANGTRGGVVYAKLKKDESNKSNVNFVFLEYPGAELLIKPPTLWLDNLAYREIIQNDLGELSYLAGRQIDSSNYMKLNLVPEEKALALIRMRGYSERYQRDVSKWQAFLLGGIIMMFFIGVLGAGYVMYSTYSASGDLVAIGKQSKDIQNSIQTSTEVLNDLISRLLVMQSNLNSNPGVVGERVIS